MTYSIPERPNRSLSNKVLVAFGEIGSDIDDPGFGAKSAAEMGINYLYIGQRKRTQYQHLSRETLSTLVREALPGRKLYLYGTSLGGYCAAYFGQSLNANILAFAPRVPAHPVTKRIMAVKFPSEGFAHEDYLPRVNTESNIKQYIFYDRFNFVDNFYVQTQMLPKFPSTSFIHIENAGHYVPRALSLSGCLKSTLKNFVHDMPIDIRLDQDRILEWHEARFSDFAGQGKIGYASEHLSVLLRKLPEERIEALYKQIPVQRELL